MDASQLKQGFWLGDWQVNPGLSQLTRDGESIQLEPRVMALLEILASKPGDVFSREELEEGVWQGTVVGYDALTKAINKLREALGDDKKDPRYIQTISKKGYRLVANINTDTPAPPSTIIDSKPGIAPSHEKPVNKLWLVIGVVLSAFLVVGFFIFLALPDNTAKIQIKHENLTADKKPTIVVLPFRNISPSDDDDYLADGLTSDLTTNLSKLSGLWVTASHAALAYKNTDISPDRIKQELNARYVLTGEVNKIERDIRINARLTDLSSGSILWAERYDRKFTDLFTIQDEVTKKILNSLSITLTKEEKQRIAKRYTNNLDAYETFLRAQFALNARTPQDNINARELYKNAIMLDPGFSRAYAGLSYSYAIGYLRQWPADTEQPIEKARELANKAIELDKDLPESYWVAAFTYLYQGNLEMGNELLKKALKLNPNYADAYALLAANSISTGKSEKAFEYMDYAYRLNPAGGYLYDLQMGRAHYFLGNHEEALNYLEAALERNPNFIDMQMYAAATYIQLGRYDDAGWMILEAKQTNPDFDPDVWIKTYPYFDNKGFKEKLRKDLKQAEGYSKR